MSLFAGKLNRLQYILHALVCIAVIVFLWYFAISNAMIQLPHMGFTYTPPSAIPTLPRIDIMVFVVIAIYAAGIFYLLIISSKRLRDLQHSPWWALLLLVGGINVVLWLYLCFAPSKRNTIK